MPRSRTNPQFNRESLPETLAPCQIGYEHIAALGGLRGKARTKGPSPNAYWRVRGFRNYADYGPPALPHVFARVTRCASGRHRPEWADVRHPRDLGRLQGLGGNDDAATPPLSRRRRRDPNRDDSYDGVR